MNRLTAPADLASQLRPLVGASKPTPAHFVSS